MKVLIIGQLPKEVGGNYTTGAANVVYELSRHSMEGMTYYTFATNLQNSKSKKYSTFKNQYLGYTINPIRILFYAIRHPKLFLNHISHYRRVDHQNIFRYLFYEDNIRKSIKKVSPNIIHVHSISNLSPVRFALDGQRIPVILTCHGIFYRGNKSDVIGRDQYLGNIGLADHYTGSTQESKIEYEKYLGVNPDYVTIIPNGVDCKNIYFDPTSRKEIRDKYGVDDKTKVIITIASVQERKGQYPFLKILKKMPIDYQYWLIGDGPDMKLIDDYVIQNNLQNNVRKLGYVAGDQLYKYYSAADFYAHSSFKEGQSLAELGAYSTGLRIIINKEVVGTIAAKINSKDYFVLDFSNVDYDLIQKWIQEDSSQRNSRTNLDWSIIVKEYYKLYKTSLTPQLL